MIPPSEHGRSPGSSRNRSNGRSPTSCCSANWRTAVRRSSTSKRTRSSFAPEFFLFYPFRSAAQECAGSRVLLRYRLARRTKEEASMVDQENRETDMHENGGAADGAPVREETRQEPVPSSEVSTPEDTAGAAGESQTLEASTGSPTERTPPARGAAG